MTKWILCATETEARIFLSEDAGKLVQYSHILPHPSLRAASGEPGRIPAKFALMLADVARRILGQDLVSTLVVCAESEILDELMRVFDEEVKTRIAETVPRNLCHAPSSYLASRILRFSAEA